jgi:hypothetical protein
MPQPDVPLLTEIVARHAQLPPTEQDTLLAELTTKLAARAFALAERSLRESIREMEAAVFADVSGRLRRALPELIDATLREHISNHREQEVP